MSPKLCYVGDLNETYQSEKGEKGQKEDIFGGGTFEQVKEKNEPSPMTEVRWIKVFPHNRQHNYKINHFNSRA